MGSGSGAGGIWSSSTGQLLVKNSTIADNGGRGILGRPSFSGGTGTIRIEDSAIRNNTGDASGDPYAKKMAPLVPRLDPSRDWTPAEVVALMDDIAAVTSIPLETTMEEMMRGTFRTGTPLPSALSNALWGEAQANGLRIAWLLEPRAALVTAFLAMICA